MQITDPFCRQRGRPIFESRNFQIKERKGKFWSWAPKEGPTPRQTGRLTVGRNMNANSNNLRKVKFYIESALFVIPILILVQCTQSKAWTLPLEK
jgi:hypothetical protein